MLNKRLDWDPPALVGQLVYENVISKYKIVEQATGNHSTINKKS